MSIEHITYESYALIASTLPTITKINELENFMNQSITTNINYKNNNKLLKDLIYDDLQLTLKLQSTASLNVDLDSDQSEEYYDRSNPYRYTPQCKLICLIIEHLFQLEISQEYLDLTSDWNLKENNLINNDMNSLYIALKYLGEVKGYTSVLRCISYHIDSSGWLKWLKNVNLDFEHAYLCFDRSTHVENILTYLQLYPKNKSKVYKLYVNDHHCSKRSINLENIFIDGIKYADHLEPVKILQTDITIILKESTNYLNLIQILNMLDDLELEKLFDNTGNLALLLKFPFEYLKNMFDNIVNLFPSSLYCPNFFNMLSMIPSHINLIDWIKHLIHYNINPILLTNSLFDVLRPLKNIYKNYSGNTFVGTYNHSCLECDELSYLHPSAILYLAELGVFKNITTSNNFKNIYKNNPGFAYVLDQVIEINKT